MDGAVGDICPRGRGIGEGSRRAGGRSKRGIVDCVGRDCGGGADRAVAGGRAKGQCAGKIERCVGAAGKRLVKKILNRGAFGVDRVVGVGN